MVSRAIETRRALSIDEVAAQLGISRNHCYAMAREGKIPARRLGKRLIVPIDRFEAWLQDEQEAAN